MKHLTYLASILMICGPTLLIIWKKQQRILRKHELLVLLVAFLGIPFASAEWFALQWRAWEYGSVTTLHIARGAEIETYLFSMGIFACVAAVTIVKVVMTDKALSRRKRLKTSRHSSARKLIYARGARKSA